jgi:hypothetical protein
MPFSRLLAITTTIVASVTLVYYVQTSRRTTRRARLTVREKVPRLYLLFKPWTNFMNDHQLPPDLDTWRMPGNSNEAEEKIWRDLDQVFRDGGYTLWPHAFLSTLGSPGKTYPLSSGFGYATPSRGITNEETPVGTARKLLRFDYTVRSC